MITLSNGHSFEYMAASGALAFDGLGWPWEQPLRWTGLLDEALFTTVLKTVTLQPREAHLGWHRLFGRIRLIQDGALNAIGLTNPGIERWCRDIGPHIDSGRAPVMGSILGEPDELALMARMLNDFDLVGIEINASCPNTGDDLLANMQKVVDGCRAVATVSRFPVVLKLSVVHDIEDIVPRVEDVVEAFSINSVPWEVFSATQCSPLAHLGGGGVSGKAAQPYTWKLVKELSAMTEVPVIGPSVWDFEDIATLRHMGAKAISFGSVFLRYPWRPTTFVRRDIKEGRTDHG